MAIYVITNRRRISHFKLRNHLSVCDNLQHLVSFMLVQIVFPLNRYLEKKSFTNQIVDSTGQKIWFLDLHKKSRKGHSYISRSKLK
ncbi:hypothetical protein BRARA_B03076 [Brassica rapa]|uniref:Uncharacterized protein n=1 Tax=Brassica campestris TaxID=3711 RepID=A0A398AE60_BRACM|nr:hypothetical protein BRARA_B03076 [Brassica rapa]